jgi:hypothetical protein
MRGLRPMQNKPWPETISSASANTRTFTTPQSQLEGTQYTPDAGRVARITVENEGCARLRLLTCSLQHGVDADWSRVWSKVWSRVWPKVWSRCSSRNRLSEDLCFHRTQTPINDRPKSCHQKSQSLLFQYDLHELVRHLHPPPIQAKLPQCRDSHMHSVLVGQGPQ